MAWPSIAERCEERDTSRRLADFSGDHRLPGSARVSRVGETVPVSPTFKECFGETPKPAPETGALPGVVAAAVTGGRIEQGICR